MNQTFDVIVYGDFLKRPTSQAENMREVIAALSENGLLGRVICRDTIPQAHFMRALPGGAICIKALTFVEVLFGVNLRSFSQNMLFDYFAARKIQSPFVIASVSGLRRSLETTKRRGGVYIEMALMENPEIFLEKLVRESSRFHISIQKSTTRFLSELSYTAKRADRIIAISPFVKRSFVERGFDPERIMVSGLGIDETEYYPRRELVLSREKKFRVLYLAHSQLLKGLQDVLEAWTQLQDDALELVIVGLIDKNTQQIIARYRHLRGVVYKGSVRDTLEQYHQSDIFIFPTLSDGLGKAAVEAMACQIPVIVTDQCGIEITDAQEGFIVPAGDVNSLEEKIRFCYNAPDVVKEMGRAARETFLNQYTATLYKNRIAKIIQMILTYETTQRTGHSA